MVVGAAGYRMQENLIRGRFCYVDDLVVAETHRRSGSAPDCWTPSPTRPAPPAAPRSSLDTALDNLLGQRFYFRYGMLPACVRFGMQLD